MKPVTGDYVIAQQGPGTVVLPPLGSIARTIQITAKEKSVVVYQDGYSYRLPRGARFTWPIQGWRNHVYSCYMRLAARVARGVTKEHL